MNIGVYISVSLIKSSIMLFQDKYSVHVYTINGKLLTSERIHCSLGHMTIVEGHVILGNDRGVIIVKELHW